MIKRIKAKGFEVIVYESVLDQDEFFHSPVVKDLDAFKCKSDVITSSRMCDALTDVRHKVFTRDLFGSD